MEKLVLPVRPTLRSMLSRLIVSALCCLLFVGFGATSGSLPIKEATPDEGGGSSIVTPVRSPVANNSSPRNDSSQGKDLVKSIVDDSGLTNADKNLIGSIVAYAVAFSALSVLFCCFLCPSRGIRPASVAPHRIDAGSGRSKAGFQGLLQSERMRILRHIFHPVVWSTSGEKKEEKKGSKSESHVDGEDSQVHVSYASTDHENGSMTAFGDTNDELVCSICLNPYQTNCRIITGKLCSHNFHYDCGMRWLAAHDDCPYCRQEFMTDQQFRLAALQVLGESRVRALSGTWTQPNEEVTDQNNSADLNQGRPIDSPHPLSGSSTDDMSNQAEAEVRSDDQVSIELGRVALSEDDTMDMEIGASELQQETG